MEECVPIQSEGWSDDQMIRFAWMILNHSSIPEQHAKSICERLETFREHESLRGIPAPVPPEQANYDALSIDDIWESNEIMSVNSNACLSMDMIVQFVRAFEETRNRLMKRKHYD